MINWEYINKFRRFWRTAWCKSLYLNFTMLPFRQAIKMPILVTEHTYFYSLSGRIELTSPAKFAMVRFGYLGEDVITPKDATTLLQIEGVMKCGANVRFGCGVTVRVEPDAVLEIEADVRIGNRTKVICYDNILIKTDASVTWECQVLDTTFHYMRNVADNTVAPLTSPIVIGAHCWIGNRCSVMKGTFLPDYTIVASNSMCNKKYDFPEKSLIAGIPARLVKTGIFRIPDEVGKRECVCHGAWSPYS